MTHALKRAGSSHRVPVNQHPSHALCTEMLGRERWPREQLLAYQQARLREIVHAHLQSPAPSAPVAGFAILKNWWRAFRERRAQAKTIALLQAMPDRDLKDIGLTRAEIEPAVRGQSMRDRIVSYY